MMQKEDLGVRLLVIGSEITQGFVQDSNTQFIASEMFSLGIPFKEVRTIPDNLQTIVSTLKELIKTGDFIITTGGLGPTDDDLTVNAHCKVFKVETVFVEKCIKRIEKLIIKRREGNHKKDDLLDKRLFRQCRIPSNAEALPNLAGLAPGIYIDSPGIISLPGFPMEIKSIWPFALKKIKAKFESGFASKIVNLWGISESLLYETLKLPPEIVVGNHALPWGNQLFLRTKLENKAKLGRVLAILKDKFGANLVDDPLFALVDFLKKNNITFSTVESCTGGLAAKLFTDVPGVSAIYPGSIVSYDNRIKGSLLGVQTKTLESYGAVSRETAAEMARGAAKSLGSDITISITGIAGPTGGTEEKPLGTVFYGIYDRRDNSLYTGKGFFPAARERFRNFAVYFIYLNLYQRYVYFGNDDKWLESRNAETFLKT